MADTSHKTPPANPEKTRAGVHAAVKSEFDDDLFDDEFNGHDSVWRSVRKIFHMTGLRVRHFFGCGVLLLLAAAAAYFFVFGGSLQTFSFPGLERIRSFFSSSNGPPPVLAHPPALNHADLETAYRIGTYPGMYGLDYPPSLLTAYQFGGTLPTLFFPMDFQYLGLQTAYLFGFRGTFGQRLELYIRNLAQVQNALLTDVNAVLDTGSNRKTALDALVRDFQGLLDVTEENARLAAMEVTEAKAKVTPLHDQGTVSQREFQDALSHFLPEQSYATLNQFIVSAQDEAVARAQLGAFTQIDKYFQIAVAKFRARVKDITSNYEALLKGVKVFDIKNSNLDLIIYEGGQPKEPGITTIDRSTSTGGGTINFLNGMPGN